MPDRATADHRAMADLAKGVRHAKADLAKAGRHPMADRGMGGRRAIASHLRSADRRRAAGEARPGGPPDRAAKGVTDRLRPNEFGNGS